MAALTTRSSSRAAINRLMMYVITGSLSLPGPVPRPPAAAAGGSYLGRLARITRDPGQRTSVVRRATGYFLATPRLR
ncbi:hypothetical protein GCM10010124_40790 [Pilimelia terevasa]|uniref:Uncharacterized protein n=1 Tax=Pilimelia terevasa TaxID=53372 RepID=A0A8J3BUF3_9ACTN|nr:hypothetical protein GCM10010124_40790 [Pilimelia terevasa]